MAGLAWLGGWVGGWVTRLALVRPRALPVVCKAGVSWGLRAAPPPPPPGWPQVAGRIEGAQGEGFLRALKAEWEAHNKSVQMIRDILMYMDRIYVKLQVL